MLILFLTIISFGSGFMVSRSQEKKTLKFDTTYTVNYRYDSTINHFTDKNLVSSKTDSIVYFPTQLDSGTINQIIEKWFTHYLKVEVFRDSNLEAIISDSIGQNQILKRDFSYKILRPNTDSLITIPIPSTQNKGNFYPGLSACYLGTEAKPNFGPAIFYSFNRIGIYAGAGLGSNKALNFGIHFNLKSKKP